MQAFLLLLSLLLPAAGQAAPRTLLDCNFENSPIRSTMIYEYEGKLFVLTVPSEGEWVRLEMPANEWDKRIIHLLDTPQLKAVIFDRDHQWHFSFKGPNGWYMAGNADCTEY